MEVTRKTLKEFSGLDLFVNSGIQSEHYHSTEKGCEVVKQYFFTGRRPERLAGSYCRTHNKDLCRCGWEWGWHFGTKSEK